jgi:hypothetical protein
LDLEKLVKRLLKSAAITGWNIILFSFCLGVAF